MAGYSAQRMRKEKQSVFFMLFSLMVVLLIAVSVTAAVGMKVYGSVFGAMPAIFCGVLAALAVFVFGAYLRVSDEGYLLRHTAYGKRLSQLGDAKSLLEEIDREAPKGYLGLRFALLEHWMILYTSAPSRMNVLSLPIPKADILRIVWERGDRENGGFFVRVYTGNDTYYAFFVWEQAEVQVLRAWAEPEEQRI